MGRKPGVPNKPKPVTGINKADAIMAVAYELSDSEIATGLLIRSLDRLNTAGRIDACRFLIQLFKEPLKYVDSRVTMTECQGMINWLNKMIADLQKKQNEEEQEANVDDVVHQ